MIRTSADLRDYLEAIDLCYFNGQLEDLGVEIGWMRYRREQDTNPVRLGQYLIASNRIEISRHLALEWVPIYVVLSVVHHEGLHAVLGPEHDRRFQLEERKFLYSYEVAQWERENESVPWPSAPKGLR